MGTITNGDLPDDKKKELLTLKAVCGTQALLSQKNTMKKLQARAVDDAMPLNKLLEGFSKLK